MFIHTKSRPFPQRPKDRVCDFTEGGASARSDSISPDFCACCWHRGLFQNVNICLSHLAIDVDTPYMLKSISRSRKRDGSIILVA